MALMNPKWTKATLANNLKYLRTEQGISQKELAQKAHLSFRLIQDIESGNGNPTVDSLHSLAVAFKITVEALLALSHVRLLENDESFMNRYSEAFEDLDIGAGIRTLNGIAVWTNKKVEKIHGDPDIKKGPFNLLDCYSVEIRGVLKTQLSAERSGFANPYTLAHLNPQTGETLYLRCVPTLIMPTKGYVPVYTSTYITEMHEDCALNYYNYCRTMLEVIHGQ